jgi:pyruvate ferredoxin oxidoreductase gamma subunit
LVEISWNGRGGQGAFTAAKLLGAAYSLKSDNTYALAFPAFGPERRGAPVKAFTKLHDTPISDRSEIKNSDFIIYLDDSLYDENAPLQLKESGRIIINSVKNYNNKKIISIDANAIAAKILGQPITNTVMLGALAALFRGITIDDIQNAISLFLPAKIQDKNKEAVRAAAELLQAKGI